MRAGLIARASTHDQKTLVIEIACVRWTPRGGVGVGDPLARSGVVVRGCHGRFHPGRSAGVVADIVPG
jgi:hypothetical protein